MQTVKTAAAAFILVTAMTPAMAQTAPATECDTLAARPDDIAKVKPGVEFEDIDADKALAACQKAVAQYPSEPRLIFQLGRAMDAGKNYMQAMFWYEKAGNLGHISSMTSAGFLHQNGLGTPLDYGRAMQWHQKAAALGDAGGMYNIGVLYEDGFGMTEDKDEARRWYKKAADLGDADARKALENLK